MSRQSTMPSLGKTIDEAAGLVSGIYRITCRINKKTYIGSAINIAKRWRWHLRDLAKNQHHSPRLQGAWNKYGPGAFVFEAIEWVETARLTEREQVHIDACEAASRTRGFNMNPTAGSALGSIHSEAAKRKIGESNRRRAPMSEESRRKMSESARNRGPRSEEQKRKIGDANRGRPKSEETRRKMSEAARSRSLEHQRKISEAIRGRPVSEETRRKIGDANRGRPKSEETLRKIGDAIRGRKHSEEAKQKMREAWVRRKASIQPVE